MNTEKSSLLGPWARADRHLRPLRYVCLGSVSTSALMEATMRTQARDIRRPYTDEIWAIRDIIAVRRRVLKREETWPFSPLSMLLVPISVGVVVIVSAEVAPFAIPGFINMNCLPLVTWILAENAATDLDKELSIVATDQLC